MERLAIKPSPSVYALSLIPFHNDANVNLCHNVVKSYFRLRFIYMQSGIDFSTGGASRRFTNAQAKGPEQFALAPFQPVRLGWPSCYVSSI